MGGGAPRIPGHEIVGDVVAIPPGETKWKVGDRVGSGWHDGHCHECVNCRKGNFVNCTNQVINGVANDGGYAEYATLRTEGLLTIPKDLYPAETAPLLCAGVTTFNSMRHMDLHPGDVIGIQGVGGLGHLAIQFARQMGYHTVAISGSSAKEALARSLGAHDYIDTSKVDVAAELQKLGGAKVILGIAPSGASMGPLLGGLTAGGQLCVLGIGTDPITIPMGPLVLHRRSIRGWPSGTPRDSEETIAFARLAGVKCQIETYPLEKVTEAFDRMMNGSARFRSVLVF